MRARSLRFVSSLTVLVLAAGCAQPYAVPPDQWGVRIEPSDHADPVTLLVQVDDSFLWPEPSGDTGEPVHYRLTLHRPGEPPIVDVGFLTQAEPFSVVTVAPRGADPAWLDPDVEPQPDPLATLLDLLAETGRRGGGKLPPPDPTEPDVQRIRDLIDAARVDLDQPDAFKEDIVPEGEDLGEIERHGISLAAYEGDHLLYQETRTRKGKYVKYTWGTPITDKDDPHYRDPPVKPEEVAGEKLRALIARVCGATNADGTPRFPEICRILTEGANDLPPPTLPILKCKLKGSGATDPLTGRLYFSGSALLNGTCPIGTILHEARHAWQAEQGEGAIIQEWLDAEERFREAARPFFEPTMHLTPTTMADLQVAVDEIMEIRDRVAAHTVQMEMDALMFVIDNADLTDLEGDDRKAWIKSQIKNMMLQLALTIKKKYKLTEAGPHLRPAMHQAFTDIRDWLNEHPDIKSNFRTDVFKFAKRTWWRQLIVFIRMYRD